MHKHPTARASCTGPQLHCAHSPSTCNARQCNLRRNLVQARKRQPLASLASLRRYTVTSGQGGIALQATLSRTCAGNVVTLLHRWPAAQPR